MARKIPPRNPRATYRRRVVAARRFGPGAKCECGESRHEALIPKSEPVICAACDRRKHGRRKTDDHHIVGEANGPLLLRVPVGDHRGCLSEAQNEWPQKTLRNPDGSPLLAKAASIRGAVDTISYLHEKLLIPAAEMLELLDTREERKSSKK
jgi:hypothetical protein